MATGHLPYRLAYVVENRVVIEMVNCIHSGHVSRSGAALERSVMTN
jgi:hypothetical protein